MYKDRYLRTWTGPFPFTSAAVMTVPAKPGVYQILLLGVVAYIGISETSIRDRLNRHVKGHGNWAAARRAADARYEFVYFLCDSLTAHQIESHVVTNSKPAFNSRPEYKHYIDSITLH